MDRIMQYINDAIEELRHVRWPTRQQAVKLSSIVLGFTAVTACVFGAIDYGFAQALHYLLSLAS